MHILLAEAEEVTALAVRGTLALLGHQVTVVTDGLGAWQRLQEEQGQRVLNC